MKPENHQQILDKCKSIGETVDSLEDKMNEIHADDRKNQLVIVSQTKQLLKSISLLNHPINKIELQKLKCSYLESVKSAISYNNKTATEIQRSCLPKLMDKWQTDHGIIPKKCRVVIVSPHGARVGRIEAQYLTNWLQKTTRKKVINRWLYNLGHISYLIKDLDCKKDIIEGFLLPTESNRGPAKDILGHSQRMNSDVLSPYFKDGINKKIHSNRNRA